jgi:hypothetical protein
MLRPTHAISRRRLLGGLAGLSAALLPTAVLAASPSPANPPLLPARPVVPPKVPIPPGIAPPPAVERWLQNHTVTTVWADPEGARALAPAAQWSYFRIVGAQVKARIPVFDPRTGAQGWVDAGTVGPSGPPPPVPGPTATGSAAPAAPAKAPPPPFEPFWVAPFKPTALALEPSAEAAASALLPQFAPLKVTGPARENFYPVEEPFSKAHGWIAADAIGKVGQPGAVPAGRWWGKVVVDEAFGRAAPRRAAPVVATYPQGATLGFGGWVEGEQVSWDDPAWGEVWPGVYVYGRLTRPIPFEEPPPPGLDALPRGRWIGINRTVQAIVAYEGDKSLFWGRTSTGRPGWETPFGRFEVLRQVAKETMDSQTLIGLDAKRADYKIENVRYTQYFTDDGNAIHENWWKDPDTFGLPSSHGCAGLRPDDAQRFWDFGQVGMPVIVHQ